MAGWRWWPWRPLCAAFHLQSVMCCSVLLYNTVCVHQDRLKYTLHTDWRHHHLPPVKRCQLSGALLWVQSTYENWLLLSALPAEQDSLVCCPLPLLLLLVFSFFHLCTLSAVFMLPLPHDKQQTFSFHSRAAGEVSRQSHAKLPLPNTAATSSSLFFSSSENTAVHYTDAF